MRDKNQSKHVPELTLLLGLAKNGVKTEITSMFHMFRSREIGCIFKGSNYHYVEHFTMCVIFGSQCCTLKINMIYVNCTSIK